LIYPEALTEWNDRMMAEGDLLEKEDLLVELCASGDRLAQKVLYEKFYPYLLGVCLRYVVDSSKAEDILHDCFIKIFRNIHKFRSDAQLKTWLTRVVINHNLDQLRKKRYFKSVEELSPGEEEELEIKEEAIAYLTCQEVLQRIELLPVGYRTVLCLYSIDGLSHKEIGKELGINEASSRSQLSKARKLLRELLKEDK
jgi:RNA polymerase sigma-70 factor (ECF subfamily)